MVQQHLTAATAPYDLTRIIKQVEREIATGLDVNDNAAVAALATKIEHDLDLMPRIHPDRRYRLPELKRYGYKPGRFYKAYKHLIHKDGRLSYVLGRALLMMAETAPTLADGPP